MPYTITTKDGITINNIPDDVDPNSQSLRDRVAKIRAARGGVARVSAKMQPSHTQQPAFAQAPPDPQWQDTQYGFKVREAMTPDTGKPTVQREDGALWYGPEQGNTGKAGWFQSSGLRAGSSMETTGSGLTGGVVRGAGPYAAGALTGAALGSPAGGVGAVPGALAGVASVGLTKLVGDPLISGINSLIGTKLETPSQTTQRIMDYLGIAPATTPAERIVQAGSEAAGGALGGIGLGQTLARSASPMTAGIGQALASNPAQQITGAITGGAASQYAAEEGAGPLGQLGAGLLGGVAGSMLARPKVSPVVQERMALPDLVGAVDDVRPIAPVPEVNPEELGKLVKGAAKGSTSSRQKLADLAAVNTEAKDAAERLGIELPADVFSDSPQIRAAAGLTRSVAGSEPEGAWRTIVSRAVDQADEVMRQMDATFTEGQVSPGVVSQKVRDRLLKTRAEMYDAAKQVYTNVDEAVPKRTPVTLEKLESHLRKVLDEVGEGGLSAQEKKLLKMVESGGESAIPAKSILSGSSDLPDEWYVSGRANGKMGSDDYPTLFTRDVGTADFYAGKNGSIMAAKPTKNAKIADFSNEYTDDMNKLVDNIESVFEQLDNGVINQDTDNLNKFIGQVAGKLGKNVDEITFSDVEGEVRSSFSPRDIVNSAEAFDDDTIRLIGLWGSKYGESAPDWVKTPDGAVLIPGSKEFISANLTSGDPLPSVSKPSITYGRLIREKNLIRQARQGKDSPYGNMDAAALADLEVALAEDQLANVGRIGGEELRKELHGANLLYAKERALGKRIVSAFGEDKDGSIANRMRAAITGSSKGANEDFNKLMKVVPDDLKKETVATALASVTRSARGAERGGFGFSEFAKVYQGLRANAPVYKQVVDILGPDSHKIMRDLYEVSRRVTDARANVLTTGKANQALMGSLRAEGLVQKVMDSTVARGAATTAAAGMGGPIAAGVASQGLNALANGKRDIVAAAGNLFNSDEFKRLAVEAATKPRVNPVTVDKLSRSARFKVFGKKIGLTDPEQSRQWILSAIYGNEATKEEKR